MIATNVVKPKYAELPLSDEFELEVLDMLRWMAPMDGFSTGARGEWLSAHRHLFLLQLVKRTMGISLHRRHSALLAF